MTENEHKLTLGSLFDGSGTMPLAAQISGIVPVWSSEIEKFPLQVTEKRFPDVKQLGDITKINGQEIEPVDIIAGGSPCFPAGTMVLSEMGYVPIESLKVGDLVCTHLGNWKPIEAVGHKEAETIRISDSHHSIVCTPNHPFYARNVEYTHIDGESVAQNISEPKWVDAINMVGSYFGAIKMISPIEIPQDKNDTDSETSVLITEDIMYIVGLWLGDGLGVSIHKKWLIENFSSFGGNKTIPGWVFGLGKPLLYALFSGYVDSNGYTDKNGNIDVTNINKSLAFGLRTIGENLGYQCDVHCCERHTTTVFDCKDTNQQNTYTLYFRNNDEKSVIVERDYNWYRCFSVVPKNKTETVYNITVADDHSYIVEGYAVHNCQDLSIAGKRAGLDGERSGLFMEQIRVIKEMREGWKERLNELQGSKFIRPRYAVWENVYGVYSSNKGEDFRTVLEEFCKIKDPNANVPRPEKGKWKPAGCIMGDGYSIAWRTFDAQYWGVPQRRRRIYLVADFGGQRAPEILFKREGLRRSFAESRAAWEDTT